MRLYPRAGATAVDDPEHGHFTAAADGGFDFPEDLGAQMHAAHAAGQPLWETQIERQHRLIQEEAARRADPATLLAAVEQLVKQAEAATPPVPAKPAAAAKTPPASAKTTAK